MTTLWLCQNSYGMPWPIEIVDLPLLKMLVFHSYVSLPEVTELAESHSMFFLLKMVMFHSLNCQMANVHLKPIKILQCGGPSAKNWVITPTNYSDKYITNHHKAQLCELPLSWTNPYHMGDSLISINSF